jgi:transposase
VAAAAQLGSGAPDGAAAPSGRRSGGAGRLPKNWPARLKAIAAAHPEAERVEVWFLDETRVGQKGRLTRRWSQKGERPRAKRDTRYGSAYIFGAVCPARDTGAALILPRVSTAAMSLMLAELAAVVPPRTQAAVLLDQAGWHLASDLIVPPSITLVSLPPRSSELNPAEKVWQYLKDTWLSNAVYDTVESVTAACCAAWKALLAETGRIRSLTDVAWAAIQVGT